MEKSLEKDKLVSVIIPAYNSEKYLTPALDSIRNQTYQRLEIIVIYDKSTDATEQILDAAAAEDSRIVIIKNDKKAGIAYALNLGLAAANGEYIARMDSDDISMPDRISKQVAFLESHPDIIMCGGAIQKIVNDKLEKKPFIYPTDSANIRAGMIFKNEFAHPTVMFNAKLLKASGMTYDVTCPGEDYNLWIRLSKDYKMANLPDVVLNFRCFPESTSNKDIAIAEREITRYQNQLLEIYGIEPGLKHPVFYGAHSMDELAQLESYINQFMRMQSKNCSFKQFRGYCEGMYHNTENFAKVKINSHRRFFMAFGDLYKEMGWSGRGADAITSFVKNLPRRIYHLIKR